MTKTARLSHQLEKAIENVILESETDTNIEAQTAIVIQENGEIIEALTAEWQFQQVLRMVRKKRLEIKRKARIEEQYLLPGFEELPERITITNGQRRPLADATYHQLREYLAVLHKRHRAARRVQQIKALMELVRKYQIDEPGITVREVCNREARKE